jgi:hypothetical protein
MDHQLDLPRHWRCQHCWFADLTLFHDLFMFNQGLWLTKFFLIDWTLVYVYEWLDRLEFYQSAGYRLGAGLYY